jgi:hypothetical protein
MTSQKFPVWIWACAALTALLSFYSIFKRNEVETANRSVSLAVEMDNVQALAASQGITVDQALAILKKDGLESIVLTEDSVASLISEGRAAEVGGKLKITDPTVQPRVDRGEQIRLHGLDPAQAPVWLLRSVSIGLNPDEAAQVKAQNLTIIARCGNVLGATQPYIQDILGWAHETGAKVFLPYGDQVLGRRDDLKTTVDTLAQLDMLYATPEFAKISGDENMVAMAPDRVVRLHSAQTTELDRMTLPDVIERYSKAARERNMRILLIRPMSLAGEKPVDDFGDLLAAIRDEVVHNGGTMGPPAPFKDAGMPRVFPALIALTVVPVAFWVASILFPWKWAGPVFGVLMFLLAVASITKTGSQLAALAASMTYPIAALIGLDMRAVKNILATFLSTTALSWVGGLVIAGMLNGLPYYVRAEQFPGVKVSVFVPLLVVAVYYFARLTRAKEEIKSPITWYAAAIGLLVLGALGFMIARTGNDAATGVSSFELQFRNILDQILPVRPRTKEFMIGHPALIIGIGLLALIQQDRKRLTRLGSWATLAIMVGAMGQTSIVNTMCHLHTPVVLSIERIAEGIVIGSIIGLVIWLVIKPWILRITPTNA